MVPTQQIRALTKEEGKQEKEGKMSSEVLVVDFWANGFGMRVRIALEEKGIEYKYMEEDLRIPERSSLVQEMNPVYMSVPVLIHGGRPICDSLVILQYIDEAWKVGPTLLPQDPHQRAHARFWSDFINKKVFSSQTKFLKSKGEAKEAAKQELIGDLKLLEGALGDEPYFGGEYFGFLDVVFIPFTSMFHGYESHGNFKIEDECPKLMPWVKRCMERESVSKILPDPIKMYDIHKKWYDIE